MALHPDTALGRVSLTVRDVERVRDFYERVIGLTLIEGGGDGVALGAGATPIVELLADPGALPRQPRTTGLYHLAILVPGRRELALALRRLLDARWPLVGAADHLVSEALYLADPEGNGIEIYRDRPRRDWRREGEEIAMATLPLDLQDLMLELEAPAGGDRDDVAEGARIGHVHLHVAELGAAERFYGEALGFEVTARGYPGALFMSAGGYHHHIGLNTWAGEGAPRPSEGSAGLDRFEVLLPSVDELGRVSERLRRAGVPLANGDAEAVAADPSGNRLLLRVGEP